MNALRTQNKLTLLSVQGMEHSFAGHEEVDAVQDQLATLMKGNLPADAAEQAKTLKASLTKIGGVIPPEGRGGGGRQPPSNPNALQSFYELNNAFNAMVSMMQIGLDMAPTPTQVTTWQKDCTDLNRTTSAWEDALKQVTDFNAILVKNNLQEMKIAHTKLAVSTCSFMPEPAKKAKK